MRFDSKIKFVLKGVVGWPVSQSSESISNSSMDNQAGLALARNCCLVGYLILGRRPVGTFSFVIVPLAPHRTPIFSVKKLLNGICVRGIIS